MRLLETKNTQYRFGWMAYLQAIAPTFHIPFQLYRSVLLMTCEVAIMTLDGCVTETRALLECGSSASFITTTKLLVVATKLRVVADPSYGTLGYIGILFGVDVFNQVVCQG